MGRKVERMLVACLYVSMILLATGGVAKDETGTSLPSFPSVAASNGATIQGVPMDTNNSSASASPSAPRARLQTSAKTNVDCRGLRSKRYISDGFCRTLKPVSEVLCTGYCVPEHNLPWYPEFIQAWGRAKVMEYRCVDGVVRQKKIKLMCDNGKLKTYKIKVVKSCACRKQMRSTSTQTHGSQNAADQTPTTTVRHDRRRHGRIRQSLSNA